MFHLTLGSAPWGEACAQTVHENYETRGLKECEVYKVQLARHFKAQKGRPLPAGLRLKVTENAHDFGAYFEVKACTSDDDSEAVEAALWLEAHGPELWDEISCSALEIEPTF